MAAVLASAGADAFFAWSPVAMDYLSGFREGAAERFMALGINSDGRVALIAPALSATQAERAGIRDVRPWKDGDDPLTVFQSLASEWNLKSAIVALDNEMPAHQVLGMQSVLPAALFRPGGELLGGLMRVKSPEEVSIMKRAGAIADDSLAAGLAALKAGATERDVAEALGSAMSSRGGTPTFTIVGAGANGAEPHHHTDRTVIQSGDVVVLDFGCDLEGYQSDITRMASVGEPDPEADRVYDVVLAAHYAARNHARVGVTAESVDLAARKVIDEAGYGQFFMHRTGHGIGMKGHEDPNIVAGNTTLLLVGDCFSVEPGVYLPGRFGIRIENIVTITENGCVSLNAEPPSRLPRV